MYRERKGQIQGIKIGKRKYYVAAEIEQVRREKPVHNKPNKRKQRLESGGGPGSGVIIGPAMIVHQQPTKPTLWTKIKALLSVFAAK